MDTIKKYKKTILGIVFTSILGGAIFYYFSSRNEEEQEEKTQHKTQQKTESLNKQLPTESFDKSKQNFPIIEDISEIKNKSQLTMSTASKSMDELSQQVQIKFNDRQSLDISTVGQIIEVSTEFAKDSYIKYNAQNRKERRQIMNSDKETYEKMVMEYNEEIENILTQATEQLLAKLNITKELFEESILSLMESGFYQQIYMLQASVRQKVKEFMPSTKDISFNETKNLIRYQIELLNSQSERFSNIIEKLKINIEMMQMIPLIISTILQDLIYEKYGIEEEDQMQSMKNPQIFQDQELIGLLGQIEQTMQKLLGQPDMMANQYF